jgi:hypothetical protein
MTPHGRFFGAFSLVLAGVLALGSVPAAAAQAGSQTTPADPAAPARPASATAPAAADQPAPGSAPASTPSPQAAEAATEQADRVRKALDNESSVDFNGSELRFYLQVVARPMTFAEYAKGSDLMHGPTRRGNPMTHQEFLQMVTPRELYSSGGITATELLQFALTNWVGQTLVRRGLEEIKNARSEQEKQQIRDRIDRELAILRAKGGSSQ